MIFSFYINVLLFLMLIFPHQTIASAYFGFSIMDLAYKEFREDGGLFNREDGILPGIVAGVTKPVGQWWDLAGEFSYYSNDVNYNGQTQSGFPFETRTDEKLFDLALQLKRQIKTSGHLNYKLYAGLGYHLWKRDIQSTATVSGLFGTYEWWYGQLGAKVAPSEKSNWVVDFRLTHPINANIKINFNGLFDDKKLNLNGQLSGRLSFAWQPQLSHSLKFIAEPYLEYWHLGRSTTETLTRNGQTVGHIFEPQSKTLNYGIMIYLMYAK